MLLLFFFLIYDVYTFCCLDCALLFIKLGVSNGRSVRADL